MDDDPEWRAKSLKTLADNQRWLDEHTNQTFHQGDLPLDERSGKAPEDQQQQQQQ